MGAFELEGNGCTEENLGNGGHDCEKSKDECIIALKVYDSCRQQSCLRPEALGEPIAAETIASGPCEVIKGAVVTPPTGAASVQIDDLKTKKISIISKVRDEFREGFWIITVRYTFEYRLTFHDTENEVICSVLADSVYTRQVILFGSEGSEIAVGTDFFDGFAGELEAAPFVLVEAKAMALEAVIRNEEDCPHRFISVTIGLFSIIKLFRMVNLLVESNGFCIPDDCEELSPLKPCDFFEKLDFPTNVFDPPQRKDFSERAVDMGAKMGRAMWRKGDCGCDK